MENITRFFIRNWKLTVVLSIGMMIMGNMGYKSMKAESYPSVNFAMALITTQYDGATAKDIETKITRPIEDEIRSVSGLKDVRSTSQAGLSTIVVRVDMDNVPDVDKVLNDIQKSVDRANGLPSDLRERPLFKEVNSQEFPVLELAVVGSNKDRARDLAADILKEELEDNNKVLGVRTVGLQKRAFEVRLDPKAMKRFHIAVNEVTQMIRARNINSPGGALKQDLEQQLLRVEGKISSAKELGNIIIRTNFSGQTIRLKDIAEVLDGSKEARIYSSYNGQPATLLVVTKKAGADTIELVQEVFDKITIFKKRHKGEFQAHVYLNESRKVENKLEVLNSNAVSGLILVVLFLFIFLPWNIGLAAGLSLPLAILGTLAVMPGLGMNLNAITILALVIALGMLVDNSVVISENFSRLRNEGVDIEEAAIRSVAQLWLPITVTAFTTIAAFLPMLVTKGIMGQFIKYIPIVVTFSLLLSLVESFFLLPMRLVLMEKALTLITGRAFPGRKKSFDNVKKNGLFTLVQNGFEKITTVFLKWRYIVALGYLGIVGVSFFLMFKANKFILFPADQTEIYVARLEAPQGTRLEHTRSLVENLSKKVKENLGTKIKHITGRAGLSGLGPTDPKNTEGNNVGLVLVYVNDDTKFNTPHTEFLSELRKIKVPGTTSLTFEAQINGPPVGNAIEATFRSNSSNKLDKLIGLILKELSQVPGVKDLKTNEVVGDDEIKVITNYSKAARLGIAQGVIGSSIRTAISGQTVSKVTLDNKEVDIDVRFQERFRATEKDLENIDLLTPSGNLVPLGPMARLERKSGAPKIKRYDFKLSKTLLGNIDEEKITSAEANQKLVEIYNKYKDQFPAISLKFGGQAENTKESMQSLFSALTLSLIGIAALLVFLFRSFLLRPLVVMSTIPLGLLGLSIAFYFHQRPLSFLALIGVIALSGIIVNSGIVLISFIDEMRAEGKMPLHEILVKASGIRLKAVIVTSLTTISGLVPTAYGIGGSDAMLIPMTLAMAWGLTSGTILTLLWAPCFYAIGEDFMGLFRSKPS